MAFVLYPKLSLEHLTQTIQLVWSSFTDFKQVIQNKDYGKYTEVAEEIKDKNLSKKKKKGKRQSPQLFLYSS